MSLLERWKLWRRGERLEKIDPLEFIRRSQAIQVRMEQVHARGRRAAQLHDFEASDAAQAEGELLLDNIRELRLEQIEAEQKGYRRVVPRG